MRAWRRFGLALAVVYAGIVAIVAVFVMLPTIGADERRRETYVAMLADAAPALVYAGGILLFVCAGVLSWAHRRYPRAALQLAEQTRVLLSANREQAVAATGGPELTLVARAINDLADSHRRLERDLEAKSSDARARVEEERNRFAALMSELTEGVLVCNADGRILLYNARAAALLGSRKKGPARADFAPLGLGRSIFALLDRDHVAHALDKIQQQMERNVERPHTRTVTAAANGTLLSVQVAPFLSAEREVAGMVFTLDDVSGLLGRERQRLKLLQALGTGVRAPIANLRAAAESLVAAPDMEAVQRSRFVDIVAAESRLVTDRINSALGEYADALKDSLTLEDMRAVDLLTVVQRRIADAVRIATSIEEVGDELWVRVDSFAFVQAAASLAARLRDEYAVRELRLAAAAAGERFAQIDLVWRGAIVGSDALALWENEPMKVGTDETPLTLKNVLERHGGEVWSDADRPRQRAWFRFLVPLGAPVATVARAAPTDHRPEYYDFDLFEHIETSGALAERRLTELTYTVFDTETTGLEPSAGDEIVSIGAVRIVNGRLLKTEIFEQLVNPLRSISREATRVHGIDGRTLADQPSIGQVLPEFHRFCEDTVLVAHNAAFDMRFLELKEASTGVRFTQPVLDTLLLSAVVHPSFQDHYLDAIAERLGVRVIGRHTALGDALVTGEIFLRLVALLSDRGIVTLGQALEAARETYHARLQY